MGKIFALANSDHPRESGDPSSRRAGSPLSRGWSVLGLALFLISVLGFTASAAAQEREGDYLYKVTTVRAAPGELEALLDYIADVNASDYFEKSGETRPFIMRHSQGDQWDLMVIEPWESWSARYSKKAVEKRRKAAADYAEETGDEAPLIAFQEDHFAYGPPVEVIAAAYEANDFYHVEMFNAAPGKAGELMEQRRMENRYLDLVGLTQNMIFRRAAGSDVDVFTIGFHESLEAFARPSGASAEEAEAAAKEAGFKDRADISFYLRSLISGHHDTLAVKP